MQAIGGAAHCMMLLGRSLIHALTVSHHAPYNQPISAPRCLRAQYIVKRAGLGLHGWGAVDVQRAKRQRVMGAQAAEDDPRGEHTDGNLTMKDMYTYVSCMQHASVGLAVSASSSLTCDYIFHVLVTCMHAADQGPGVRHREGQAQHLLHVVNRMSCACPHALYCCRPVSREPGHGGRV